MVRLPSMHSFEPIQASVRSKALAECTPHYNKSADLLQTNNRSEFSRQALVEEILEVPAMVAKLAGKLFYGPFQSA